MDEIDPGDALLDAVAIVGISARFPGAPDVDRFWENLCAGVEAIRSPSDEELIAAGVAPETLADPRYVRARGTIASVDQFDPAFFGMSPREAQRTDPQHRIFLECAWEALERAGYDPARYAGEIGVYAGCGQDGYLIRHLIPAGVAGEGGDVPMILGNDKDYLATRVAYKLGLRGPAITVQTACSTALVATQLAWQALLGHQCSMAIAGGVSIGFPLGAGHVHQEGNILSPDGHCRAFDARAQGTVAGDGVGAVVLKRLADALADGDHIHAILRGAAVNNDGADKVGFTAPSVEGQAEVIAMALGAAGVEADAIGYVEAHGTGTPLGDPIEIAALTQAYRAASLPPGSIAIGSVKTNIGHLNAAAGVAGLIKAALVLERGQIPPSLHYREPNPAIDFAASPFFVNATLRPFARGARPRRAAVSAFGFGGTNAHAVLEEPPPPPERAPSRSQQIVAISARTPEALDAAAARLADHLRAQPDTDLADVAFTLAVGRRAFAHRRAVVASRATEAAAVLCDPAALAGVAAERPIAFLFPGQGAQRLDMTADLYRTEPAYRAEIDRACDLLVPHLGRDLREVIFPRGDREAAAAALDRTALAQPALFVVEHALARLLVSWGVKPAAMLGHSVGELVAACLAGVFSLPDALALAAVRGRLMDALPPGAMLAVPLPEREILARIEGRLAIAAVNAPSACVVSGAMEEIEAFERALAAEGVSAKRLRTSHAFHSAMMAPALDPFAAQVARVARRAPAIPYASNVTGAWITAEEATDPAYWARHLREAVRFSAGLATLREAGDPILLEVGPGRALTALAAQSRRGDEAAIAIASLGDEADGASLRRAIGRLWTAGAPIDWSAYHAGERRRRVPLPTYPFERARCWVDAPRAPSALPDLAADESAITRSLGIRSIDERGSLASDLDTLCAAYVVDFLRKSGVDVAPGAAVSEPDLVRRAGITSRFERLFAAMIAMLVEDGIAIRDGAVLRFTDRTAAEPTPLRAALGERHPDFGGLLDLIDHCARRYPEALTGRVEPISVLYPDGSPRFVADCQRRTAEHRADRVYLDLLRAAVLRIAGNSRPIRVIEVGSGSGTLTWPLREALGDRCAEYCFTDLGRAFVEDARAEAARRGLGSMTFAVLDVDRAPEEQGFAGKSFDLVVAYNVVHAARDIPGALRNLGRLLAPEGVLGLVEVVRVRRWDTLTWGLAEGWWHYADGLREASPLLDLAAWERVLRDAGFAAAQAYPRDAETRARVDHGLVLGRGRPAVAAKGAVTAPPKPERRAPRVAPRAGLERQIAAICEDLLGVQGIGADDDLFALGADSLLLLRLTDRIRRDLGREIPAHAVFRGSTVERLARALTGAPDVQGPTPLVPIQPNGSRPPLYFVHPAAGVVFPYVELSRELGAEQPFYGLQALGLDGQGQPDQSVPEMARHYVEALRAVQPRGPYHLGGFSFGCLVAYEMAIQIRAAGDEVGLLALVDEPAPIEGFRPTASMMARFLLGSVRRSIWPHLHDYFYLRESASGDGGLTRLFGMRPDGRLLKELLARSAMADLVPPGSRLLLLRQPAIVPMFELFLIHLRETVAYVPRAYAGKVTLVRGNQSAGARDHDGTLGWSLLAAGGVDVHEIRADHLDLVRQPHVKRLAALIAESLDGAIRGG